MQLGSCIEASPSGSRASVEAVCGLKALGLDPLGGCSCVTTGDLHFQPSRSIWIRGWPVRNVENSAYMLGTRCAKIKDWI